MEAVVFILVFVVLWAWVEIIRSKQVFREQNAALAHRVWSLEKQLEAAQTITPRPEPVVQAPAPEPVVRVAPTVQPVVHMPPPVPVFATAAPVAPPPIPPRPITPPAPQPPPPPAATPRKPRTSQDWEALIGGNLLSKVGALLLVIGIMTFLAYLSTQWGPAGRAGLAVLGSVAILGTGVWLERREPYKVIARSLIGGGWAALYATAYAIHALPAARIIESPVLGSFVVLAVAAGMIGHSLRYKSQAVTAVAFFSAFAALAITPNTSFAVLGLIPLAAAVLYLGQRFGWYEMALMGVVATYGACASRGSSGAPLIQSETLFIIYWALFEVFDLMRFERRVRGWAVELIFPLNTAGFLGLSFAAWTSKSPETIWMLSCIAALLYTVSTVWRLKVELDRGFDPTADFATRVRAGSYEAPLTLGAFLVATAIVQKLTGMWMSTALALEAQALYTAGVRFRSTFLRALATLGFAASLVQVAGDRKSWYYVNVLGHQTHAGVLLVLFHALLFYANRAMSEAKSVIGIGFGWMGTLMIAIAIGAETPLRYVGVGWMLFSVVLFELGIRKKLSEFRLQSYILAFVGGMQSLVYVTEPANYHWSALAFAATFFFVAALRASFVEKTDVAGREWPLVGWFTCGFSTLIASVLIIKQAPDEYAGLLLWVLAMVVLELGIQRIPPRMRLFAYPVAALATLAVFGAPDKRPVKFDVPQVWGPYLLSAVAAWIMAARLTVGSREGILPQERGVARNCLSGVGLVFAMIACWVLVPDEFLPAAWAALGLAAIETGSALDVLTFRIEGQVIAFYAAFAALGLTLPDGHTHRVIAIGLLVAVLIGCRVLSAQRTGMESKATVGHEIACAFLVGSLIFQEVSGGMLTMAWGAEALALLGGGFVFRERSLRLEGLSLFLVCVLKLFLYDLRNLETPYRILSFIALGVILLGVSWVYTRFREQLQKIL